MSDDDPLDEENHERIDRVRGKRDGRRSRQQAQQAQGEDQAPQEQQGQQGPQAEQETTSGGENSQTEPAQAQQATQGEQEQQAQQEKLEPVTQREHDTFYLSEDVRSELNQIYRRVSLDVLEETGVDIDDQAVGGRNRYFRPLALLLGAQELQDMTPAELRETIEQEGLIDDLPETNED
jgi:FtsZ-interacting cell division protein ZipA